MHDGRLDTGRDKRSQRLPPPNSSYFASFRNHIDILLLAPWNAHLDKASGYSFESAKHVRIANPVSFLTQKLLIQKERDRRDRAKDTLYIHDTIEVFAGSLAELRELFAKEIRPKLGVKKTDEVRKAAETLFGGMNDLIREAVRMAVGRKLKAQSVM